LLIQILTLFPQMFAGPFSSSIIKRAVEKGLVRLETINFRDYAFDRHRSVDDTPYGGGPGMVLKPEPLYLAVEDLAVKQRNSNDQGEEAYILLTTPQGEVFRQETAVELSKKKHLVFICGHYEGFDERIRALAHREFSIGDFVLTGGELPAMVMIDSIVRLIPEVLGAEDAAENDSFAQGLLDYPQYTRPAVFRGMPVPEVLLSGHHARINAWRREQSLLRTAQRRPDLLRNVELSPEDLEFLRKNGIHYPEAGKKSR
jgi:tRNA (guanine37-N1)-methyltransferase